MQTLPSGYPDVREGTEPRALVVVALLQQGNDPGALGDLANEPAFRVIAVDDEASLESKLAVAAPAAVALDVALGEGWPQPVAERLVDLVGGQAPVMVLCDSEADRHVLDSRLGSALVTVVSRGALTAGTVAAILRGMIAARAAGAGRL